MKGLLFTRFLRFAEDEFGPEVVRTLAADQYSPAGHYDHRELSRLAGRLAGVAALIKYTRSQRREKRDDFFSSTAS